MQPQKIFSKEPDPLFRSREGSSFDNSSQRSRPPLWLGAVFVLSMLGYAFAFWWSVKDYWFNPLITTDDALQQLFPFHAIKHPEIFKGDLITETMVGYLAPIHYWVSYFVTYLTGDPVVMGHWVMLIQLSLALVFLFLAVRNMAGLIPACFSVIWFLHTRNIVQRMTGGLVRGWSPALFVAFFYFVSKRSQLGVLITLLCGCLTNPPATVIIASTYGLYLIWNAYKPSNSSKESKKWKRQLLTYVLLSPLYILITFSVVSRPAEIGQMVGMEQALSMPEFDNPGGRFPFLPFEPVLKDIRTFGLQAFISRWYEPHPLVYTYMPHVVVGLLALLALVGLVRKRAVLGAQFWLMPLSIFAIYFISREVAFKLYVPNRHLQIPIGMFLITALPVGLWRVFYQPGKKVWPAVLSLVLLGGIIFAGSIDGLQGLANFNYDRYKRGHVFEWIRKKTAEDSLIAGQPTHIDPVQLYGIRRGYATTETAHPFYQGYYSEIARRLEISLRANYATSYREFVDLLKPEGIDYFVFRKKDFYPEAIQFARYFKPFHKLVAQLRVHPVEAYVYKQLPKELDPQFFPGLVFRDAFSAVVDIKKLDHYLTERGL